jgi:hypothetical protein
MATLRVTNLRGRTGNASPTLPDGAVVTGVTTTTTLAVSGVATAASSVIAGIITANSTGIDAGAGIITATSFTGNLTGDVTGNVTGSATTIAGAPNVTLGNVNAGVVTATSYEGSGALLTGLPAGFTELDAALFN